MHRTLLPHVLLRPVCRRAPVSCQVCPRLAAPNMLSFWPDSSSVGSCAPSLLKGYHGGKAFHHSSNKSSSSSPGLTTVPPLSLLPLCLPSFPLTDVLPAPGRSWNVVGSQRCLLHEWCWFLRKRDSCQHRAHIIRLEKRVCGEKLESDARIPRAWEGKSDHHQDGAHFPNQGLQLRVHK